ncbi:hypothetical protein C1645_817365 [Glomus cerebriforme]|uniref:Uncharacterized protein n=1 Tax=Glomus cerebriforme TaxID=658196 RepID=A0A397TD46_9GLOM|nr:hypothetical protein C1645_817365 [Glomus cerebriforme]
MIPLIIHIRILLTVANIKDIIFKRREVEGITEMNIWKVELDLKGIEDILPKMTLKNLAIRWNLFMYLRDILIKMTKYLRKIIQSIIVDLERKRKAERIDKKLPENLKIPVTQHELDILLSTDVRDHLKTLFRVSETESTLELCALKTSTRSERPDYRLIINNVCPFRGEEKSPSNNEDPKSELRKKLNGLGYFANGAH